MKIEFFKQDFMLHSSGALYWPGQEILIVADLHLEKGSHFAQKGFFLPPYDSRKTLMRLLHTLEAINPARLLILGDCFHDKGGYSRLAEMERILFSRLLAYAPIWIKGNHDGDFVPPNFESHETYEVQGIALRHEAVPGAIAEISGHYHPKAELSHKGETISRPCFIEDAQKMILPAFGAYTGGLLVDDPAIRTLFGANPRIHLLGNEKIYTHKIL